MIYTMPVTCPKFDCSKKHYVILDGKTLPNNTDRYEFVCPDCQSRVLFIPFPIVEAETIPPGAVRATRRA